jgi:hypothetical protein
VSNLLVKILPRCVVTTSRIKQKRPHAQALYFLPPGAKQAPVVFSYGDLWRLYQTAN